MDKWLLTDFNYMFVCRFFNTIPAALAFLMTKNIKQTLSFVSVILYCVNDLLQWLLKRKTTCDIWICIFAHPYYTKTESRPIGDLPAPGVPCVGGGTCSTSCGRTSETWELEAWCSMSFTAVRASGPNVCRSTDTNRTRRSDIHEHKLFSSLLIMVRDAPKFLQPKWLKSRTEKVEFN